MAFSLVNPGVQDPHRESCTMGAEGAGYSSYRHLNIAMPDLHNQRYLELEQYKDASHLTARIQLHRQFSTNPYGWFKWVFDQLNLPPEANILEIGCGPGSLWTENMHRIPPGWQITLSDFSPGMVNEANRNVGLTRDKYSFVVSNGMAIPFPTNSFNAIIANHVIYHFPSRKKALAEISRVLKPDGLLFASTIGKNHLLELSRIMEDFSLTGGNYYSPALNPSGFTLENGANQLAPWFKQLEVYHYPDALVITEAKPLMEYILSMLSMSEASLADTRIADLYTSIIRKIAQHGSIHIQKSSGMFVGIKRGMGDE